MPSILTSTPAESGLSPEKLMTELNYQSAGVDLKLYEQAMQRLPGLMAKTRTSGVMDLPGGFAGLFRLSAVKQWTDPVLVSGTDGVGTKIKLAIDAEVRFHRHRPLAMWSTTVCVCMILRGGEGCACGGA